MSESERCTIVGALATKHERRNGGYPLPVPIYSWLDADHPHRSVPKHAHGPLMMAIYAGRELQHVRR